MRAVAEGLRMLIRSITLAVIKDVHKSIRNVEIPAPKASVRILGGRGAGTEPPKTDGRGKRAGLSRLGPLTGHVNILAIGQNSIAFRKAPQRETSDVEAETLVQMGPNWCFWGPTAPLGGPNWCYTALRGFICTPIVIRGSPNPGTRVSVFTPPAPHATASAQGPLLRRPGPTCHYPGPTHCSPSPHNACPATCAAASGGAVET